MQIEVEPFTEHCAHSADVIKRFVVQPDNAKRDGCRFEVLWCGRCGAMAEMTICFGVPQPKIIWMKPPPPVFDGWVEGTRSGGVDWTR